MKALRTLGVALMVVTLVIAVPVAAIALNLAMASNDQPATASGTHMSAAGMFAMMGSRNGATATAADQLTIIHVQKGCHVWSDAGKQMVAMHLRMHTGQMLKVMNQDVDMHRMVLLSGPMMMRLGGPMAQGKTDTLTFNKPGTYVFGTKVSMMKGMPDVQTIGPDNNLKLTVTVV
jgi:hypothetical protein